MRVRKKSLLKELKKQKETVYQVRKAIENGRRKSLGTISESVIHRLVGMSVGRVDMRNYNSATHDMCWKNGFRELTMNKFSCAQMKELDRSRNKIYYKFDKDLKKLLTSQEPESDKPPRKRQIIDFNKPFSYFYQVLERNT